MSLCTDASLCCRSDWYSVNTGANAVLFALHVNANFANSVKKTFDISLNDRLHPGLFIHSSAVEHLLNGQILQTLIVFCVSRACLAVVTPKKNPVISSETGQRPWREQAVAVPRSLCCSRWEQVCLPAVCQPWLRACSESGRASKDSLATVHGDTQVRERWCTAFEPAGWCWGSRFCEM